MSGASRAFTKTAGSIFFASACAAPLARMTDRFSRPRAKIGTEAWYIESVMDVSPEWTVVAPETRRSQAAVPPRLRYGFWKVYRCSCHSGRAMQAARTAMTVERNATPYLARPWSWSIRNAGLHPDGPGDRWRARTWRLRRSR